MVEPLSVSASASAPGGRSSSSSASQKKTGDGGVDGDRTIWDAEEIRGARWGGTRKSDTGWARVGREGFGWKNLEQAAELRRWVWFCSGRLSKRRFSAILEGTCCTSVLHLHLKGRCRFYSAPGMTRSCSPESAPSWRAGLLRTHSHTPSAPSTFLASQMGCRDVRLQRRLFLDARHARRRFFVFGTLERRVPSRRERTQDGMTSSVCC